MHALRLEMSLSGGSMDSELASLGTRLADLSGPLEAFGRAMMDSVRRNFDEQGRPVKWKRLAETTVRRKRSAAVLVDTGRLRGSLGFSAGPERLRLYAKTSYAAIHQYGGRAGLNGSVPIPARPFIVFQKEDLDGLRGLVAAHLLNNK